MTGPDSSPGRVDPVVHELRLGHVFGEPHPDEVRGERHWRLFMEDRCLAHKLRTIRPIEEEVAIPEPESLDLAIDWTVFKITDV